MKIQSKVGFSWTQKNSSTGFAEKESSSWLIFHCRIEQTIKKAAAKVVNENLHWGASLVTK